MASFKVGDRVAVYGWMSNNVYVKGLRGTILKLELDGSANIDFDKQKHAINVHLNQCRRLVKKKRREWDIVITEGLGELPYVRELMEGCTPLAVGEEIRFPKGYAKVVGLIRVREVRVKK